MTNSTTENIEALDPVRRREGYIERIKSLLDAVGMIRAGLDVKIDRQLQTEGGIDTLSFDGLQKVITWLESKRATDDSATP